MCASRILLNLKTKKNGGNFTRTYHCMCGSTNKTRHDSSPQFTAGNTQLKTSKQHTDIHTWYILIIIHTYIHTYIHTCIHTYIRARSKGISLIGKACAATVSAKFAPHRNFCTPPWFVALNISQYFNPSDPSSCPGLRSYTPPPASEHEPAYVLVRVKRGFPSP